MKALTQRLLLALMFALPIAHGDDGQPWAYEWDGADGGRHELKLTLSPALAEKAFMGGGDLLDFAKISDLILSNAQHFAASLSDESVVVTVSGDSLKALSYQAQSRGDFPALVASRMDQMKAFMDDSMEDVEHATYYEYNPIRRSLEIDYNEIAADYQSVVLDTLIALGHSTGTEDPVILRDELLDMLQSIPYNDLRSDDFPLLNPMRMLIEKRGDCESKQLFMATAMKILMPESRVELILLPQQEHIVMRHQVDGEYVLIDATGPSRTPAGSINPAYHLSGAIYYELIF
jgi:hypothetical protein